jgi:hypothetical protein
MIELLHKPENKYRKKTKNFSPVSGWDSTISFNFEIFKKVQNQISKGYFAFTKKKTDMYKI